MGTDIAVAYVILAHRLPNQLLRLIDRLDSSRSRFLIHISRNAEPGVYELLRGELAGRSNCMFLPRQIVYWGRFGLTDAIFDAIDVLAQDGDAKLDYMTVVSGQDYPVAGLAHIDQVLERHRGFSLLEVGEVPNETWGEGGLDRFAVRHLRVAGREVRFPPFLKRSDWMGELARRVGKRRDMPFGFTPYGGSSWFSFTFEAVEYLHQFRHSAIGKPFISFFRTVIHPEEMLFHTVLMNSELASRIFRDEYRYVDWSVDERHPALLQLNDYDAIVGSGAMFARKFDETVAPEILGALDRTCLLDKVDRGERRTSG